MKYLHLGGSADGLWIETDGIPNHSVSRRVETPILKVGHSIPDEMPAMLTMDRYRLEELRTRHQKYQVYILEEMDADDMIKMLFQGYLGKIGG